MTGADDPTDWAGTNQPHSERRVRIESTYDDEATAARIAGAIEPDNTSEMETSVDGTAIVTEITRSTTGGLQATVDDYVVNLQVAAQLANQHGDDTSPDTTTSNTDT
jgi:hypothetical protein